VSPNFYRLPELLRNSGHSKVVSKKRGKERAGKSMSLVLKVKKKGEQGRVNEKFHPAAINSSGTRGYPSLLRK
jgi:hypothetical protein